MAWRKAPHWKELRSVVVGAQRPPLGGRGRNTRSSRPSLLIHRQPGFEVCWDSVRQRDRERTSQIQNENIVCFLLYVELRFKYINAIIYIINSVQVDGKTETQ